MQLNVHEIHKLNSVNYKLVHTFIDSRAPKNYVNGCSSPVNVANDFMKMYRDVFCAGHTSCHNLQSFQNKLHNLCIDEKWQPFNVNEITSAYYKLKPNKKDDDLTLVSIAIPNALLSYFHYFVFLLMHYY